MGEEDPIRKEEGFLCDFCGQSKSLLYCRADTARLCLSCDRHVHLANSVCSKHPRSLLCNSCSSAPSSILCSSHGRVLCSNCDFEAHSGEGVGHHHERRPVESFSGCPSSAELVWILGIGEGKELLKKDDAFDDLLDPGRRVWDTPKVVRLDDLIVLNSVPSHGFQAVGVPPLPKNRNLACGEQKEEILQQLRELIKSEGQLSNDSEEADPVTEFQSLQPHSNDQQENLDSDFNGDAQFTVTPDIGASELQWNNNNWHEATDQVMFPYEQQAGSFSAQTSSFPDGVADLHTSASPAASSDGDLKHHIVRVSLSPLPHKPGLEFLCPDRDSVISRYKEKRRTRRYDKLIRYESRKARADTRVRIKGRFAKVNEVTKP